MVKKLNFIHLDKYCEKKKENTLIKEITLKVIDLNFDDDIIIYQDINDAEIIIFEFISDLLVEDVLIFDDTRYSIYMLKNRYNTLSKIISRNYNKSDTYLEKASYSKEKLGEILKSEEVLLFI